MKGFTKKPCPACGQTLHYYKTGGICKACIDKMNDADSLRAQFAKEGVDRIPVRAKQRDYALPHVSRCGEAGRQAQKAFFDLGQLLTFPSQKAPIADLWPGQDYQWNCAREVNPAVADSLSKCYAAMLSAVDAAYMEGHRTGSNLLMQLSSGKITATQFNDKSIKGLG